MNSLIMAFRDDDDKMIIRRTTSATGRHVLKIPFCRQCGDACTVCAPKFGQPTRCCLSSQLAREDISAAFSGTVGKSLDAQPVVTVTMVEKK